MKKGERIELEYFYFIWYTIVTLIIAKAIKLYNAKESTCKENFKGHLDTDFINQNTKKEKENDYEQQ